MASNEEHENLLYTYRLALVPSLASLLMNSILQSQPPRYMTGNTHMKN